MDEQNIVVYATPIDVQQTSENMDKYIITILNNILGRILLTIPFILGYNTLCVTYESLAFITIDILMLALIIRDIHNAICLMGCVPCYYFLRIFLQVIVTLGISKCDVSSLYIILNILINLSVSASIAFASLQFGRISTIYQ